jgi:hypothetical protein
VRLWRCEYLASGRFSEFGRLRGCENNCRRSTEQAYIPLNIPVTYAETRSFAQAAAMSLEREHPRLIVSEMAKQPNPS